MEGEARLRSLRELRRGTFSLLSSEDWLAEP
jgi:hypothetical protein